MQLLNSEDSAKIEEQLAVMLLNAKDFFSSRQMHKALDTLHQAHTLATANGLHRHAAQFKRALSILGSGGRPKLLTRADAKLGDREER